MIRSARITRQAAISFAEQFDPQPMHTDETAAIDGFFQALTVSGWHALSLTMRLVVEARPFGDEPLIGAELSHIRFSQPIMPDTDLKVQICFDAVEGGKGRHRYNILSVNTLDVQSEQILIRQRWRMLQSGP